MAWTPTIKVIDTSVIVPNLITYIKANQTEALSWVNDGAGLRDFKTISDSIADRSKPIFPRLSVQSSGGKTTGNDLLITGYAISFEAVLNSDNDATIADTARKYDVALSSMISNIPATTLTSGADNTLNATLFSYESQLEELGHTDLKIWYQEWKAEAIYQISGSYK